LNKVIVYGLRMSAAISATPVSSPLPVIVPDRWAFRVRFVEFRWRVNINADQDVLMGVSKLSGRGAMPDAARFDLNTDFIANGGFGVEASGTEGLSTAISVVRRELWDYDYRMVMRPEAHLMVIGSLSQTIAFFIGGELVPASEGERNAIIAWQGGAKDA